MKGVKNKIILLCFYFQKCVQTFIGYFPTLFLSFSILPFALHGLLQIANSLILSRQALRLSRHFAIGVDDLLNSGRSFVFIIFVYYCLPELSRSHSFNIEESYAEINIASLVRILHNEISRFEIRYCSEWFLIEFSEIS